MPTITAHDLRRLAEKADALRDQNLRLVQKGDVLDVVPDNDSTPGSLATVRTESKPGHPPLTQVTFVRPTGIPSTVSTLDGFDALMWKESAVQKFVFPYYAFTDPQRAFEQTWTAYWAATEDSPVYAVLHDRSRPEEVGRRDGQPRSGFSVVTNPVPDPERLFEWTDPKRRGELARQGILAIEDFTLYLTRR